MRIHQGTTKDRTDEFRVVPLSLATRGGHEESVMLHFGRVKKTLDTNADEKEPDGLISPLQAVSHSNERDFEPFLGEEGAAAKSKACWVVPFARNPRFIGRSATLDQLERILCETESFHIA